MNLTKSQKKFLKKNLKKLSFEDLAAGLGISPDELRTYLREHLAKEKYEKYSSHFENQNPVSGTSHSGKFGLNEFIRKNWPTLIFLTLLALTIYLNSLGNDFLSDDISSIRDNPKISNLNPEGGFSFIFNLRSSLLAITYRLFGLNPFFFRLTNLLCHLGSTLTLFTLMNFFFSPHIPLLVASLFAVHPILAESVTWISGGPYSISTFFLLLTFLVYIKSEKEKKISVYFISFMLFYLALTQAFQAVVFTGIIFWYELTLGSLRKNWKRLMPFTLTGFVWALYLFGLLGQRITALQTSFYQQGGLYNPLAQIPIAVSSYLSLIFWPSGLTLYHSEMAFTNSEFILRMIMIIGFIAIATYFIKKDKRTFFWLSFFIIALLPSLTPLKIAWIVAERYVYMGSIGIFVLVAYLVQKISERLNWKILPYLFLAVIIPLLSIRTIRRNRDWKNQDTLWLAAAKTSPSSPQNHNNLGDLYSRQGEFEKAVAEFKIAIELLPNYGDAYHNLANTYLQMGEIDLAIQNYQKALQTNSNIWQSYQNLAAIYLNQKNFSPAAENLKKAIQLNPGSAKLHTFLAFAYINLGESKAAREELMVSLQLDPNDQEARKLLEGLTQPPK
ncbi:MAG TPA: tetratricopeptide repeat protein [Clostridia bacterium]|nr:tetratricopeptide repeat protein [Clostridia bacterium]